MSDYIISVYPIFWDSRCMPFPSSWQQRPSLI